MSARTVPTASFVGRCGRAAVTKAVCGYTLKVLDLHGCLVHRSTHVSVADALVELGGLPWGPWREESRVLGAV
ncbi:hypothetical protein [Gordonibacter urolithinfaciens]|uniref:hypothetical protein n=1 Tax=Gordonibacter urolithinfaciens TaxID=1335613 RepID=UPI003A909A48